MKDLLILAGLVALAPVWLAVWGIYLIWQWWASSPPAKLYMLGVSDEDGDLKDRLNPEAPFHRDKPLKEKVVSHLGWI